MTDMPERIWLDWPGAKHGEPIYTEPPERDTQAGQTEYVRAEIVQALTAERDKYESAWMTAEGRLADTEAERDRLRGAIEYVLDGYGLNGPDYRFHCGEEEADWITDHLIAALKGETP